MRSLPVEIETNQYDFLFPTTLLQSNAGIWLRALGREGLSAFCRALRGETAANDCYQIATTRPSGKVRAETGQSVARDPLARPNGAMKRERA